MRKAAFLTGYENNHITRVYNSQVVEWMKEQFQLVPEYVNRENAESLKAELQDVEIAFSTWGMPKFTEEEIAAYFPNLRAVFYGAGSVQAFARPFLNRGITVVSAWAANAVPVAEYSVSQILLANKGYFMTSRLYKQSYKQAKRALSLYPGNYGAKVGILGAGMIGRGVIERLRAYELELFVFDPFLPDQRAKELGVVKCELTELFACCDTISNHLANVPATVGMLHKDHFDRMLPHATFINTGRGAQIVESDLIRALQAVPTRTAVLDVTFPEPVQPGSELMKLDNVVLTPHIAGSMGNEVARMGLYMKEECFRYLNKEPLKYSVTVEMLETMA